jgi:hypothetical protein
MKRNEKPSLKVKKLLTAFLHIVGRQQCGGFVQQYGGNVTC